MKRDMDLVRSILFEIEKLPPFSCETITIDGYSMQEIAYHCEMLYDEGYIKEYNSITCDNFDGVLRFTVRDLTWEGQDLLEVIRQDTVWNRTKATIKEKGLSMVTGTIKTIASALITSMAEGVANSIMKNGGLI